jgi:hypothetical protein
MAIATPELEKMPILLRSPARPVPPWGLQSDHFHETISPFGYIDKGREIVIFYLVFAADPPELCRGLRHGFIDFQKPVDSSPGLLRLQTFWIPAIVIPGLPWNFFDRQAKASQLNEIGSDTLRRYGREVEDERS